METLKSFSRNVLEHDRHLIFNPDYQLYKLISRLLSPILEAILGSQIGHLAFAILECRHLRFQVARDNVISEDRRIGGSL